MNIIVFIIIIILYLLCLIILYISLLAKRNNEKDAFINNLALFIVFVFSLTMNLIIINFLEISNINFLVFPFDLFTFFFIILFTPIFFIFVWNEKRKFKNKKGNIQLYLTGKSNYLPLKYEIYRKLSHLVVLGIILFYFTFGFWTQNFFLYVFELMPEVISNLFYSIFSVEEDIMIFTQYLVVFLVTISIYGLLSADFIRILRPNFYPLKPVNVLLREKELFLRLGPQISMSIGCFSIIVMFGLFQPIGPLVICASMLITIFGDITSNLIGRTLGKKKIRDTNKTYVGLFSGMLTGLISAFIFLSIIKAYEIIGLINFILIPIIGCFILGFLDYLDLVIDDNLTYPFFISTVLFFQVLIFI